jgi:hypothetical protein
MTTVAKKVLCFCLLAHPVLSLTTRTRARPATTTSDWSLRATKTRPSRSVKILVDWSESVGIQKSPSLELAQDAAAGWGWQSLSALSPNQVLLQVPTSAALTVESPGQGPNESSVVRQAKDRRAFTDLPWFVQFAAYLVMLRQGVTTERGDVQPWLNSLPTVLDTPVHWTVAEKKELQYDFMEKAVLRQEKSWKAYHELLKENGFGHVAWDDFLWGCEMARSRAFSGAYTGGAFRPGIYAFTLLLITVYVGLGLGSLDQAANGAGVVFCATVLQDFVIPKLAKTKKYVICPLIDMANHQSIGNAGDVSFEYFGNVYSLATSQAVPSDKPVMISYGARSNDDLLQYYGFSEVGNPHDVYVLPPLREWPLADLEAAAGRSVAAGRLQALERAGLLGRTSASDKKALFDEAAANADGGVVVTRTAGLDPAVWQALRALFCTDDEWKGASQSVGSFAESAPSSATETCARAAAKCALEWELQRKATTLEQDENMLQRMQATKAVDASVAEKLAIQFRIEKKKILQECLQSL